VVWFAHTELLLMLLLHTALLAVATPRLRLWTSTS